MRVARCCCGQLSVECRGEPARVSVCHCLACQRRTGSVFGAQARFRDDQIRIQGRAKRFERTGDDGGRVTTRFCTDCGSTVYWTIDALPGAVAIAVGAFADPAFPRPTVAIYEDRRHPWVQTSTPPERLD